MENSGQYAAQSRGDCRVRFSDCGMDHTSGLGVALDVIGMWGYRCAMGHIQRHLVAAAPRRQVVKIVLPRGNRGRSGQRQAGRIGDHIPPAPGMDCDGCHCARDLPVVGVPQKVVGVANGKTGGTHSGERPERRSPRDDAGSVGGRNNCNRDHRRSLVARVGGGCAAAHDYIPARDLEYDDPVDRISRRCAPIERAAARWPQHTVAGDARGRTPLCAAPLEVFRETCQRRDALVGAR